MSLDEPKKKSGIEHGNKGLIQIRSASKFVEERFQIDRHQILHRSQKMKGMIRRKKRYGVTEFDIILQDQRQTQGVWRGRCTMSYIAQIL